MYAFFYFVLKMKCVVGVGTFEIIPISLEFLRVNSGINFYEPT